MNISLEDRGDMTGDMLKAVVTAHIVDYEERRHRNTYGDLSKYELKKIRKDVDVYIKSLN